MLTHDEMVRKMLKRPAVKAEYDAQLEEFALLDQSLHPVRFDCGDMTGANHLTPVSS